MKREFVELLPETCSLIDSLIQYRYAETGNRQGVSLLKKLQALMKRAEVDDGS